MDSYFYWCGVVVNILMGISLMIGVGCSIAQWFEDLREERYFHGRGSKRAEPDGANQYPSATFGRDHQQS